MLSLKALHSKMKCFYVSTFPEEQKIHTLSSHTYFGLFQRLIRMNMFIKTLIGMNGADVYDVFGLLTFCLLRDCFGIIHLIVNNKPTPEITLHQQFNFIQLIVKRSVLRMVTS